VAQVRASGQSLTTSGELHAMNGRSTLNDAGARENAGDMLQPRADETLDQVIEILRQLPKFNHFTIMIESTSYYNTNTLISKKK
jgi:hypothetical protein